MLLSLFLSWTSRQGSRLEHRLVDDHDALTTALQFDFSIATFTGWDLSGPFRSICVCVSLWFSLCIGHLTLAFAFAWSRKALIYSRPPLCDLDISGLSTLCVTISCACWLSFLLFCFFSMLLGELRYTSVYFLYKARAALWVCVRDTVRICWPSLFLFSSSSARSISHAPRAMAVLSINEARVHLVAIWFLGHNATLPPSRLGVFAEVKKLKVHGT